MKKYETISDYIADSPKEARVILKKMRQVIQAAAPKAVEDMKYGMPTFKLNGQNLVHFAGWKSHIGFYPTPGPIVSFKKELAAYATQKGSIQFQLSEPIPYGLVTKIVKYRVKQSLAKRKK